jgi:putative holliday junction resolvase
MNYLGVDWGERKIGLALGSDETKIASPILILNYNKQSELEEKLKKIIEQEDIEKAVVGAPTKMSGEENIPEGLAALVGLLEKLGLEVDLEDERLSTKLASNLNREFKGYNKVGDDDLAATAILQSYFDKL